MIQRRRRPEAGKGLIPRRSFLIAEPGYWQSGLDRPSPDDYDQGLHPARSILTQGRVTTKQRCGTLQAVTIEE
jgi:hypothetical protein